MTTIKLISILILTLSLFFLGCVDQKQTGTPVPTVIPTATVTAIPTVVPTSPMPTPVPTQIREQMLFISDVDDLYGFYKVAARNGSVPYDINTHTLTINAQDSVRWRSTTQNNYILTIVSQEALWDNSSSKMKAELSYFNYTFDKPGEYEVYLKEFPRLAHQKIIVNP